MSLQRSVQEYVIYFTRDPGLGDEDYKDWQSVQVPSVKQLRYKFDHQIGLKPKTLYRVRIAARNKNAEGPPSAVLEFETAYAELPIPTDIELTVEENNTVHVSFTAVRNPDDHALLVDDYKIEISTGSDVLSANWTQEEALGKNVDHTTSQVRLHIDGRRLQKSTRYWLKVTANVPVLKTLAAASKPRQFTTGDGKLRTHVSLPEGPVILRDPALEEELRIECLGSGTRAPVLSWTWNGAAVPFDGHLWTTENSEDDTSTRSVLVHVGVGESANVTCTASLPEDTVVATAQLRVSGPGSPPRNISVIAYKDIFNISWLPPEVPNGEITRYIVYYTNSGDDELADWAKVEVDAVNSTEDTLQQVTVTVKGALEKHFIRVQSISDSGPGIISSPLEVISDEKYVELTTKVFVVGDVESGPLTVEPGDEIRFRCFGKGSPTPNVTWMWIGEATAHEATAAADDDEASGWSTPELITSTAVNDSLLCQAANRHEERVSTKDFVVLKPGDWPHQVRYTIDDEDKMTVHWKPADRVNGELKGYVVYLGKEENRTEVDASSTSLELPPQPPGIDVPLKVAVMNEHGEGKTSPVVTIHTPAGGPKDPPQAVRLQMNRDGNVTLRWKPPINAHGTLTNFVVYFTCDDSEEEETWREWQTIELPADSVDIRLGNRLFHVDPRKEDCRVRVTAGNERAQGPPSRILSTKRVSAMTRPRNTTAVITTSTLSLHLPKGLPYQDYAIYVQEEVENEETEWHRYEVFNVTEETIVIEHIPQQNPQEESRYRVRIAGRQGDVESEKVDVKLQSSQEEPTPTTDQKGLRPMKEPPL